ncbi:MAG: indole-3-glycerol phosphate synthase TrpC [Desulfomonilaceae bacterium]
MSTILGKIADLRLTRLAEEMRKTSRDELELRAHETKPPVDFAGVFTGSRIHVIAEIKKGSPSRGILRPDADPEQLARAYAQGGASAISVLTEADHFFGSLGALTMVKSAVSLPVLRKDFILDPYQVVETRASGADSFLLIAALLDRRSLGSLMKEGRKWGLEPLVEVHDVDELEMALKAGARVIGINNRDLNTFRVDVNISLNLIKQVPTDCVAVSESGIQTRDQIVRLADAGFRGVLIGESLVTSANPAATIRGFLHGAS